MFARPPHEPIKGYNWQQKNWPHFTYDSQAIDSEVLQVIEKMGYLSGQQSHLSVDLQEDAILTVMVEEAIKTSAIEGEYLNYLDVRSSIQNKLGLKPDVVRVHDKRASGIAELLFAVRQSYQLPLTDNMLFDWYLMLMAGLMNANIRVGYWRTNEEPMQIVSGYHDKWKVHFEAPPSARVPSEMEQFITWFNDTAPKGKHAILYAPVRSAIAHLYFECIHPFEDGNGRIGRAIAEKALSQGFGYPVILSLSQAYDWHPKGNSHT